MNGELVESKSLFLTWRPNRSLSPSGRSLWLCLIAVSVLTLAVGAALLGGWMVLPFAGGEVFLVWLAFRLVARHDGDYETFRIADQMFSWERCECGHVESMCGNVAWLQVSSHAARGRFELEMRYAGKRVALGAWMSDEQRRALSGNLGRILGRRLGD